MRGQDEQQSMVFSYNNIEDRIPQDHPLRRIRQMTDVGLRELWAHFESLYARVGAALDSTGAVVAGAAVAGAVFDSQRAAVDGATRLQPAVPLVRGIEPR